LDQRWGPGQIVIAVIAGLNQVAVLIRIVAIPEATHPITAGRRVPFRIQVMQYNTQFLPEEVQRAVVAIHPVPITGHHQVIQVAQGLQDLNPEARIHLADHLLIQEADHLLIRVVADHLQDLLHTVHLVHLQAEDRLPTDKNRLIEIILI